MAMKGKESENGMYEFPYMKPPQRTGWENLKTCLYDPTNGTVFGRTGKNWVLLLLFYTIFYVILGILFAICMQAMLSTINDKEPKWQLDSSLIGSNPGLGFRPISNRTEEGSLIWFNSTNQTSTLKWIELTEEFLKPYLKTSPGRNKISCDFDKRPDPGKVCDVDLSKFGPCSPEKGYGYSNSSSPCVFLKLNRIINWVPETYNDKNNLPGGMSDEIKKQLQALKDTEMDQIWVSCYGEHPADVEHLKGFEFFPSRGFPGYFYPYTNEEGYLSPLVAVRILNPTHNVVINIECRAWAKNINYRGGNLQREGSIHFELMLDV